MTGTRPATSPLSIERPAAEALPRPKLLDAAARWALVGAIAVAVFLFGTTRPHHNWDMIGYVAASLHKDGYRGSELLEKTYAEVRDEVPPERYAELLKGDYRRTVAADPAALEQQVPFYSIRVAYVESLRMARSVGIDYPKGTYFVSALFSALCVVVLGAMLVSRDVSALMLPVVAGAAGYFHLAAMSSPDSMTALFALLAIWSAVANKPLALVIAVLLPVFRTDFVLLSCLICAVEYFRRKKLAALAAAVASIAVYQAINVAMGNYGWTAIFNFSFINQTPYPAEILPSSDWRAYARPYLQVAISLSSHTHFLVYGLAAYALLNRGKAAFEDISAILLVCLPVTFVLAHLALFPTYEERFFVFAASLVLVWICSDVVAQRMGGAAAAR